MIPISTSRWCRSPRRSFAIVVQAERDAKVLLPDVRRTVNAIDPELPLFNTGVIEDRIARHTAGP